MPSNYFLSPMTLKKNYFCSYIGTDVSKKYSNPEVPVACEPMSSGLLIENIKNDLPFTSMLSTTISSSLPYCLSFLSLPITFLRNWFSPKQRTFKLIIVTYI